jgi:hypothetical protein
MALILFCCCLPAYDHISSGSKLNLNACDLSFLVSLLWVGKLSEPLQRAIHASRLAHLLQKGLSLIDTLASSPAAAPLYMNPWA